MIRLSERLSVTPQVEDALESHIIPFGEWLPDIEPLNSKGCVTAKNILPQSGNYRPAPGLLAVSTALTARCQGAFSAVDKAGDAHTYSGDATKLYRLASTTMTDSSKSGGYSLTSTENWSFIRWGNTVIAAALEEPLQTITMGGTQFADLATSTLKPQARHISVVRNFVVLGYTSEGGTITPHRVRWCAFEDPADWDESQTTGADHQDLESSAPGAAAIQRIIGREFAIIFGRRSIFRMDFVGYPDWFAFSEIETGGRGALAPGGVIAWGDFIFFLAEDGFYQFLGDRAVPIGANKFDRFVIDQIDMEALHLVSSTIDPVNGLVMWAIPGTDHPSGAASIIVCYDMKTGQATYLETDVQCLVQATSLGYTLDGLDSISTDLDSFTTTLDSPIWQAGASAPAAFDTSNQLGFFDGSNLTGLIETGERRFHPTGKFVPQYVRPFVDGGTQTVNLGKRLQQTDTISFGAATSVNGNGEASLISQNGRSRYHRFRVNLTGSWTHAMGLQVRGRSGGWQ